MMELWMDELVIFFWVGFCEVIDWYVVVGDFCDWCWF